MGAARGTVDAPAKMRGRRRTGVAATGILLLIVVIWMVPASGVAATKACLPAPESVTLGTFPYATQMPTDLATGAGVLEVINKKFCTKVTVQTFQTAAPMVSGLSNGQLQFAIYSTPNNVNAAVQGLRPLPFQIAAISHGATGIFMAPKSEQAENGRGLPGLKKLATSGTRVGLVSVGGAAQLGVNAMLEAAGVDYTKVPFVGLGVAGLGSALASGQVRLGFASIGSANLISSGQTYSVLYSSGKTGFKATGPFPQLALNTLPSFAKEYPALTQAMVNYVLQGLFIVRKNWRNPGAAYGLLAPGYRAITPYSQWPAAWRYLIGGSYPVSGLIVNADMVNVARLMKKYGLIPQSYDIPAGGWTDPSFVRNGYKQFKKPVPKTGVYTGLIAKVPN
jgi:ABC-type nitrate/sulfonate/bicarbonate transport system substrate-binding protein